ncbi:MAG: glycosyltransferase [Prevotellaceae bacterium]|jgi:glycosyltransferase involved in cell wall biosynthesis|nr:glycosyltransferase [Prevotellaceae bacterium]
MDIYRNKVSVIIPTYNCRNYVRESIESVLAQSWPNIEIIIQDNASSDDTYNIELEYARKYPKKVTLFRNVVNSGGCTQNIMLAMPYLLQSPGFLYFFSGDDVMYPHCIERCVNAAIAYPSAGLFHIERDEINMDGTPRHYLPFYDRTFFCEGKKHAPVMMMSGLTTLSQIMVRKDHFRPDCISFVFFIPTDWFLNFTMAMRTDTVYLQKPGIAYRIAEGNETSHAIRSTMQIIEHYQMLLDFVRSAKIANVPTVYNREKEAVAHLAQMAVRYAVQMVKRGFDDTAKDYLDFALILDKKAKINKLFKLIHDFLYTNNSKDRADVLNLIDKSNSAMRTVSYNPPEGFTEFNEKKIKDQ